jgi:hypothetical protein
MFEVISSPILTRKLFKVIDTLLIKNKSLKIPLFENWLPLPTNGGIAGADVRFRGLESIILCYHVENHRADLGW